MINKCPEILEVLERLDLHRRGWEINDYWEGDRCAIGISSKTNSARLVYLCTFNMSSGTYYIECDEEIGTDQFRTVNIGNNLTYAELVREMSVHLGTKTSNCQGPF